MDASIHKVERYYVRLFAGFIGAIILLVVLCWGGRRLYVKWQERRLMRQAHSFAQRGQDQWAALAAQRAHSLSPGNVDACRTMGDLTESRGDASAVDWRRRVVELEPTTQNRLQLAGTALRFNQPAIAAETLEQISAEDKTGAGYHAVAAHVAQAQNNPAAAEMHLEEAARLAPGDSHYRLDLALFQMESRDPAIRQKGQATAESLRKDPAVRGGALRALVAAASRAGDGSAALDASRELRGLPEATFTDRLNYLSVLRAIGDDHFAVELGALQDESVEKPDKIAQLLSWLNAQGLSLLALDWTKRLPAESIAKRPIPVLVADSYSALADWTVLQQWVKKGTWGDFDFLRHAYLARAMREQGNSAGFESEWAGAVKAAANKTAFVLALAQTAGQWKWKKESIDLLWLLTEDQEQEGPALDALNRYYTDERDSAGLYRVVLHLVKFRPNDLMAQNNYALLSLLMNIDASRGQQLARELYDREPKNPAFASTYAYALYLKRDYRQARKVMEALSAEQLRDPSFAAYYGLILGASGDPEKAREYLGLAKKARLLPEEKAFVERAVASFASP